ncbi:MAG: UvrD-helicase domain-containing protein [Pirellulales bacterium]|nr:UvrD-helicase domain-containing protein [Pirellulales bacterium]
MGKQGKRENVDRLLQGLTEAQRCAVTHFEGPLLILAGPGSGKTRVVTHRIAWLLAQGVPDRQILALTFTNKAADEMQRRIKALVGDCSVWVGTFHRFCARMLRKYAPFVGLQENYSIYDTQDSLQVLRQALARTGLHDTHIAPETFARAISWAKNNLIAPDQYVARPGHMVGSLVQKVYPIYQGALLDANAADFDDLLYHCANLLRENPEVRQALDERHRFILVDEYQDTNLAQYAIARALSIDHPHLAVTGDPDQSIYGWRGANLNNILEFERDYPAVRVVRLEQNYRSTKRILRAAAELIAHNVRRKEKGLYTENSEGPPVRLVTYGTHKDEADDIAARMAEEIRQGRRRAGDFAVFYRVNALSREFELALRQHGVPFQLVNSVEFFQRKEIKDLIGYLHLLNNPHDQVAFLRVINTPARGIGKTTVGRLSGYALQHGWSLLEAARRVKDIPRINAKTAGKIAQFVRLFDRLVEAVDRPMEELLGLLLAETGFREQFSASGDEEDSERLANIEELLTVAREFDERHGGGTHPLETFIEETALVGETDEWEEEVDRATLMTLHAAKGLEFPVVFLVAVEEGLLPHQRSKEEQDDVEEERRLMFVGMTRARQELQLSFARYRDFRGRRKMTVTSSFLMELPREEMELLTVGDEDAEKQGAGVAEPAPYFSEVPDYSEAPHDQYDEPVYRADATFPTPSEPPAVSPDVFLQGMTVLHPQYGRGRIAALSGSGLARQATVDFPDPTGRMRFLLSGSPLRPAE